MSCAYQNGILHGRIDRCFIRRSPGSSVVGTISSSRKVVSHLRVELISSLLNRTRVAPTSFLVGSTVCAVARFSSSIIGSFGRSSRPGLGLGLLGLTITDTMRLCPYTALNKECLLTQFSQPTTLRQAGPCQREPRQPQSQSIYSLDIAFSQGWFSRSFLLLTLMGRLSTRSPFSFW